MPKLPFRSLAALGAAAVVFAMSPVRDAEACGGCFVSAQERTVVTDHRMALAISRDQTVLWDQIRYSGDPAEFAWVLPVRAGAKVEVANDELFTALDASTQPVVVAPNRMGGGFGCALTGCSSTEAESMSSSPGAGQVQVLGQSVVGPYETVTLRATDSDALSTWLKAHAFAIPDNIAPTIAAYVSDGFDFIALRLRPGCGERAMQPVRVVTKGADPTLPLRMVAAGVGARVGITLWVISEGRYEPQNFPSAVLDESKIRWDRFQNKSNYEQLSQDIMGGANGRTWHVEYAQRPQTISYSDPFSYGSGGYPSSSGYNPAYYNYGGYGYVPGLADTYYGLCKYRPTTSTSTSSGGTNAPFTPCPKTSTQPPDDTPSPTFDAGSPEDAGSDGGQELYDAGQDGDAGADAGPRSGETKDPPRDAGSGQQPPSANGSSGSSDTYDCRYLDDLQVAFKGMALSSVWVTRLRATLPADALSAGDLRLEPSQPQAVVTNVHFASTYLDEDRASGTDGGGGCLAAPKTHSTFGSWVLSTLAGIAVIARLRRRRR